MKVELHPLREADLWDVGSAKPTRAYIRFPIFYCLLENCKIFK